MGASPLMGGGTTMGGTPMMGGGSTMGGTPMMGGGSTMGGTPMMAGNQGGGSLMMGGAPTMGGQSMMSGTPMMGGAPNMMGGTPNMMGGMGMTPTPVMGNMMSSQPTANIPKSSPVNSSTTKNSQQVSRRKQQVAHNVSRFYIALSGTTFIMRFTLIMY